MGCATRAGDNAAESPFRGVLGVAEQQVGGAMGGDHPGFMVDLKVDESLRCVLHDLPVGVAAHHDSHEGLGHRVLLEAADAWRILDRRPGAIHGAPGREGGLRRRESSDGYPEWGAGDVIHPQPIAEAYGGGISAVFAADAELEIGPGAPTEIAGHADELSDSGLIQDLKWVGLD